MSAIRKAMYDAMRKELLSNERAVRAEFGIVDVQEAVPLRNIGEYWAKYGGVWCRFKSLEALNRAFDRLGPPKGILS